MSINIIAACDLNLAIGNKQSLLCHMPSDLKRFKQLTQDNYIVMGSKTYDSIGHPLPNRHNIILSRNKEYQAPVGTFVYHSIADVIKQYHNLNNSEQELWFIGGGEVYHQALPFADRIYLTIINNKFSEVDSFFPRISLDKWKPIENIYNPKDEKHEFDYSYVTYERRHKID